MTEQEKREKVIEGLQWCINEEHDCYNEKGCPYENEDIGCKYALHKDAIALLKAQEPVEPHRNYKCLSDYWCEFGWHLGRSGSVKYCANCGRLVKWE